MGCPRGQKMAAGRLAGGHHKAVSVVAASRASKGKAWQALVIL
jgi:hypothetical protein